MSQTIYAARVQTAVPIQLDVSRDGGITGLTIAIKIFRDISPAEWLDFDDGTFKAAGHTTPTINLDELDATEAPGMYIVAGGFDISAITIPAADEALFVHYDITAGGETGHDVDTIQLVDQLVRDAMKLAPSAGAPITGSVDAHLDTIEQDTTTDIPALIAAVRGTDNRDLTELAGAGWVAADNLVQAHNKLDLLQADIDNFENVTRVKVSLPTFERPSSGTTTYEFYFNLKDEAGDPVNADGDTVTLEATSHGGVAGDRDSNLGSTVMVNIGVGRYRGTYAVGSAHALEGIHLSFSWSEDGNADVCDKSLTVLDSDAIGYLSSDRIRDDQIAAETAAILIDTAEMQPKLPAGNMVDAATNSAEHAATLAAVNALVGQGLTAAQAAQLLYLWTFVGGDPTNPITVTRAILGTPGSTSSSDSLVNQIVTQIDNSTATFAQQP